jgi:outer membrane lipoprotein-sorting protein
MTRFKSFAYALLVLASCVHVHAEDARTPAHLFGDALRRITGLVEPAAQGGSPTTFFTRLDIVKAEGLPKELSGQSAALALQAPDRVSLSFEYKGKTYAAGRNGQEAWVYVPDKKFGVVGKPGLPRFASAPEKRDQARLGPLKLPLSKEQLALLPLLTKVESGPGEQIEKHRCHVLTITPKPEAIEALRLPNGTLKLWVRDSDNLPIRMSYADGKGVNVELQLRDPRYNEPWPAERWNIPARPESSTAWPCHRRTADCGYLRQGPFGAS